MAREIKDEINPEMKTPEKIVAPPRSRIQIPIEPEIEEALVEIILDDYEHAKDARNERDYGMDSKGGKLAFDPWLKGLRDLYTSRRESKDIPWKFCSNRSLRMATSILDLLVSRLFPAVINENTLRWRPGELNDVPKKERIEKLMKWWLWVNSEMRDFFEAWVMQTAGYGDSLTESYWKITPIDKGESEDLPKLDPGGVPQLDPTTGQPVMEKIRRISLEEKTASRIYPKENVYLQKCSKDIRVEPVVLEDEFLYRELEQGEAEGKFVNVTTLLKEKLPFEEPANISDPEKMKRLRDIKLRNEPVKIYKWYGNYDVDGDGFAERIRIVISPKHRLYLGGIRVIDLTKSGRDPLDFTKYQNRIEGHDENSGEGILEKIKELSDEIDALFNQMSDSNTLSVLRPGFYDPSGDVDAPVLKLAPNRMTPVSDPSRNVYFPEFQIQTDKLVVAIRLVLEFIERLTAASSYVLGRESEIVGGSGTATRTNAIMQSAEQRFALPAERLRAGAARIITQHLDLLQLNIPPGLENRILGEKDEPIFGDNELSAEGITGKYDAYLLPDPSMGSKQTERDLASMFYSMLLQNVLVGTDPAKIYKVTADLIKAYDKDPVPYIGPEPDADMIDEPEDENTLIVQGDFKRVKAQIAENHILHIQKHTELLTSQYVMQLATIAPNLYQEIVQFTQQHILEHQQQMQIMIGIAQKFGSGGKQAPPGAEGSENGNGEGRTAQGAPGIEGMLGLENTSGPLAGALDSKRAGQVGVSQA